MTVKIVPAVVQRPDLRPCDDHDAARISDALWAHALPQDGLEHVRARSDGATVQVVLFLREHGTGSGEERSATLLQRICSTSQFTFFLTRTPPTLA